MRKTVVRIALVAFSCGVLFSLCGAVTALVSAWLIPGYFAGVHPTPNRAGYAVDLVVGTRIIQGFVVGVASGTLFRSALACTARWRSIPFSQIAFLVFSLSMMFMAIGSVAGATIGATLPEYYRSWFSGDSDPAFSPVEVGIGLGSWQGMMIGLITSLLMIFLKMNRPTEMPLS